MKTIIDQFLSRGKNLTLLNGKIPREKNWTNKKIPRERLLNHNGNLGWVLGIEDLVIDVDPRGGGEKSFENLIEKLSIEIKPTVNTPSGGFHAYLKIPEKYQNKKIKKNLKEYPGIDFLSNGSQCVIPYGRTEKGKYEWSDDIFGEFNQIDAPENLIEIITDYIDYIDDIDDFTTDNFNKYSSEKIIEILANLNPSMPNDQWVKVGMALHDWDPIEGLELWEEWSKDGNNYVEGDTAVRWRSFHEGGGVTFGTVNHMVKSAKYDKKIEKINEYIEKIKFSDEKSLEFDLIPRLREENFSKIHREKIGKSIQDRFRDLSGIRIPINHVRDMIRPDILTGTLVEEERAPDWCKNWVYVNSHAGFINLRTLKLHKTESFNLENGKFISLSDNGTKPSAAKYVSDKGFIRKVDTIAYLPTCTSPICKIDNLSILNSFNPRSVPVAAKEFSTEGLEAIEKIKRHIKFICTTKKDSHIFTQWLAHQVQFPGRKILWSPVVQSIQGVGKSFFGELLRVCLGDANVGTVSPSQVTSDFNSWATNVVVNVLEELRMKGHNRFDAINALKPLITDRMIQINEKGIKQFITYNTTNYICFTNHKDALPLDEDDRRWWVIFVPIQSLSEIRKYTGEEANIYFSELFDSLRLNSEQVRKWLLDYKITDEFMEMMQAPMTDCKRSMIATEEASFEGLHEIREIIESGGKYFNKDVISSSDLFEVMAVEHPEMEFTTVKKNLILKKLGYVLMAQPVKIDKKTRRIWAKKILTPGEIREILFG